LQAAHNKNGMRNKKAFLFDHIVPLKIVCYSIGRAFDNLPYNHIKKRVKKADSSQPLKK
jgi:hypothetical protein